MDPKVTVWTSRVSGETEKVTTVPTLTCSVDGNIANSSAPPGPAEPTLTVFAAGLIFAAAFSAFTSAKTWASSATLACAAEGAGFDFGSTKTVPAIP